MHRACTIQVIGTVFLAVALMAQQLAVVPLDGGIHIGQGQPTGSRCLLRHRALNALLTRWLFFYAKCAMNALRSEGRLITSELRYRAASVTCACQCSQLGVRIGGNAGLLRALLVFCASTRNVSHCLRTVALGWLLCKGFQAEICSVFGHNHQAPAGPARSTSALCSST